MHLRLAWSAAIAAILMHAGISRAQVYQNLSPITIPEGANNPLPITNGPAFPYPSQIVISNAPTSIGHIKVNLFGVSHEFMGDVVVQLAAPNGARIKLFEPPGGLSTPVSNVNLSFASDATTPIPSVIVSGTYAPTGGTYVLPNSGSTDPGASNFDPVIGSNPNGTWKLYVYDRANGDVGSITSGWSIELAEGDYPLGGFVYQGRIDGAEPGDLVNLRFTPYDALRSSAAHDRLANPVTVAATVGENGLVTAEVDFGVDLPTDRGAFLQVDVSAPAGSPFVSLSPRQPIAPAPLAARAVSARFADEVAGVNLNNVARTDSTNTFAANQVVSTGRVLSFGAIGNRAGTAENTDFIAFDRVNVLSNITELRLILGDDPTGSVDAFSIGTSSNGTNFDARFTFKTDGSAFKPGGGSWTAISDRRLKHNIQPLTGSLDKLMGLRGVSFEYNDPKRVGACDGTMMGFIAQDVEPIFPRWVSTGDDGFKAITITGFEALTVEALRDLRAEKDAQIAELNAQMARMQAAHSLEIEALAKRLERLESQAK